MVSRGQQDGEVPDIELAVLTAQFDAPEEHLEALAGVLARYVVLTRHEPQCRNVDLIASTTVVGRFLIIEKWDHDQAARDHLDSAVMATMAREAVPLLAGPPTLDLYQSISAHDLA